jgi:hypothetical protein
MLPAPLERAPLSQLSAALCVPVWGSPGRLLRLFLGTDKLFSSGARDVYCLLGPHNSRVTPTRQLDAKCARPRNHQAAPFPSLVFDDKKIVGLQKLIVSHPEF